MKQRRQIASYPPPQLYGGSNGHEKSGGGPGGGGGNAHGQHSAERLNEAPMHCRANVAIRLVYAASALKPKRCRAMPHASLPGSQARQTAGLMS
jgi:hypothetical protein